MAKVKKNKKVDNGEVKEPQTFQQYDMPEGYEERTSDLVGFWDQEKGPIHFVPRYAKVFDSHIEAGKSSIVIVGQAVGSVPLLDSDGNEFDSQPGDVIGVWYKPGMVQIKSLADVRVFMYLSGEQDVGKINPMKTYKVGSSKKGNTLYLTDDYRKKSKHTELPFEKKGVSTANHAAEDDEDFGDNTPPRKRPVNATPNPPDTKDDINF